MSDATDSHRASIREEFAHQADAFARSPTMSLAETLDVVVDLAPADPTARSPASASTTSRRPCGSWRRCAAW